MIVLRAKDVPFEITYINTREKPDWFVKMSPHGKVPILNVDGETLFESNAIAEFLDEVAEPRLHPADPIKRAKNRAWTDFVPDFAKALGSIYRAKTESEQQAALNTAATRLRRVEDAIQRERGNDGPYFNGDKLSLVDASYAPFLNRFTVFDARVQTGLLDDFPLIQAWRNTLLTNEVVIGSLAKNYLPEFAKLVIRHGGISSHLFESDAQAAA